MSERIHKVKRGNVERWSFGKIKEIIDIPYLIEVQKNSYEAFVNQGVREVLDDFSPIVDYGNKIELEFLDHSLSGECKYSVKECKNHDATYTVPLRVKVRLTVKETGVVKEAEVFMGDFPRMTENGTFIINGAERVVVSQLVRSPGVYTAKGVADKNGTLRYETTVIPSRGAWLEFIQDSTDTLSVRVDRQRKIPATLLLRALGIGDGKAENIAAIFGNDQMIENSLKKDGIDVEEGSTEVETAKIEVYRRLRPGEVPTPSAVDGFLKNMFFDARRYDLAKVGRYKFNKHLSLANRIAEFVAAEDVATADGEILVEKGQVISPEKAVEIQNAGINSVLLVNIEDENMAPVKVVGNNTVDLKGYVDCDPKELGITEKVYYPVLQELIAESEGDSEKLKLAIRANVDSLVSKHITEDDIIATISYNVNMRFYNKELKCGYHEIGRAHV